MPDTPDTPAARLRALRARAGLTQQQLADRLGITQGYVADVERGRRVPGLDWLHDAATALGWDPHELDPRLASTAPRIQKSACNKSGPRVKT